MKGLFLFLISLVTTLALEAQPSPRVVAAGGTVTEIVYALGQGHLLVGVDSSSLYPEAATKLPQVGYVRALSAEGLLSLAPTLVLTTVDAGPPAVVTQVGSAGVRVETVPGGASWEAAEARITFVAQRLGVADRGRTLVEEFRRERTRAEALVQARTWSPRVLFIYSRGAGTLMVAGRGTEAQAIVSLAGGTNAITGYEGYRPLTPEALASARPDVVLLTTRGLEALGGVEGLRSVPGFQAGAGSARVVALDDLLLLGFGPRLPEAVKTLEAQWPRGR